MHAPGHDGGHRRRRARLRRCGNGGRGEGLHGRARSDGPALPAPRGRPGPRAGLGLVAPPGVLGDDAGRGREGEREGEGPVVFVDVERVLRLDLHAHDLGLGRGGGVHVGLGGAAVDGRGLEEEGAGGGLGAARGAGGGQVECEGPLLGLPDPEELCGAVVGVFLGGRGRGAGEGAGGGRLCGCDAFGSEEVLVHGDGVADDLDGALCEGVLFELGVGRGCGDGVVVCADGPPGRRGEGGGGGGGGVVCGEDGSAWGSDSGCCRDG